MFLLVVLKVGFSPLLALKFPYSQGLRHTVMKEVISYTFPFFDIQLLSRNMGDMMNNMIGN